MTRLNLRRYLLLLGLFLVGAYLTACAQQSQSPGLGLTPKQSPYDSRFYRYITLDNGLRALLVSDADTEKAAASLDVYVGSAQNPRDRAGLAHFLEHMLFLGTEKYPHYAEYEEFVTEHGGSRNAYTGFEHTNYFFDIDQPYLAPALDRFAQFFIAPRFDAEYVERETNAVEAEYQLGIKTDGRRTLDVLREVVNSAHPFSILGVGTAETLAGSPDGSIGKDLLDFYEEYYSANLMTLVVLGRETPDQLEAMVREKFAQVPNREKTVKDIEAPLYLPGDLPRVVYIQPEASQRQLQLSFPLPDLKKHYQRKSVFYISNLLGHEGGGSVLSLLKAKGWAETLGASAGLEWRGGSAFSVSITLTELGLREYEQVLEAVFEYIEMLRFEGPNKALYDEQAQIAAQKFRFRESGEPIAYVSGLANDLHYFQPQDVLSGGFEMTEFNAEEISGFVDRYLTPENALIVLIAKGVPVNRESEYYFTPYSVAEIADSAQWRIARGDALNPALHLPAANEFVADNVDMRPRLGGQSWVPTQVLATQKLSVWFSQDQEFRVPKGALYASFRTSADNDAHQVAAAELYVNLLRDSMNEITYPAQLAGLNFSLYRHARGLTLKINGYDDKQLVLLESMVRAIEAASFDEARFTNIKSDLIRNLENYKTLRPFQQVMGRARQLFMPSEWSETQIANELEALSLADIEGFASSFWKDVQVDALLNGNYVESHVVDLQRVLGPLLKRSRPGILADLKVLNVPADSAFVYPVETSHGDAVVFQYVQMSNDRWHDRALASLTGQVLKSGFFQQLRTQQQLGYVVSAFYWPLLDVPGVGFLVQSPATDAVAVANAIDEFIENSLAEEGLTEQQFGRHRAALMGEILEPHKNLSEQSEYYWQEISRRRLDFDSREQLAAAVEVISFGQWRAAMQKRLIESPSTVRVISPGKLALTPTGVTIDSVNTFVEEQSYFEVQ